MADERHTAPGFSDVDASGRAEQFADYLRVVSATDFGREGKAAAVAALGLVPGARALDVGCGLGEEVLAMAEAVAPGGRAVGVDASHEFVARALAAGAARGSAAEFVVADAHALPFEDGSFDAVRTERTLQHLEDPAEAVLEMARVCAPGGVVAASEPDWDTLAIDVAPLAVSRRVQAAFRETVRCPTVGRSLRRMMLSAGLHEVRVEPSTIVIEDARLASQLLDLPAMADQLIMEDEGAGDEIDRWLEALAEAGRNDTFLVAVTGFFVVGRVPA